ncbi:acyl-CoA carboxylase subunit beta [Corallococcus praedator]|uniref:Acyl-CoA carboxylase subunit beta n=1 Tax=Corallococcus praedator TaxID=2316724 RepID=A0ABX9QE26_9BACT|nr:MULTISPECIES: acyl-CoA carboxylase subunit beta [Corallococcus]RKH12752.1 acyl-CoA carboxylase subunit beta [Corallococcus sp. CA047B]RKH33458.1 acyl-CoA carboxylase subunit beta [Corallococcus sp. CA031C]RKH99755.1 acyl-CoA carboxylase subunit beta [Corallococcus praedator]
MKMTERVEKLAEQRQRNEGMGGPERVERQHAKGKLTARERLKLLFDAGTFEELGLLAGHHGNLPEEDEGPPSPADGVITGTGEIDGRPVAAAIYDFTVYGGSIGEVGERKVARLRDIALKNRIPMVWLVDSAGARLDASAGIDPRRIASFADTGYLFREQVVMSGVIPQVAAMVGPGAAGTAYIPGLADFLPMVKGTSSLAIGGPYLVESTVGEKVTEEELGGAKVHNELSGVADAEYPDDATCLAAVREYLGFFPSHCEDKPPRKPTSDPFDRRDEDLLKVVPESPRQAFDMHKVILSLVDDRKFFPMKPRWARNLITGLARIDGYPLGIVANNSMQLGGILDVNAADKAARFINLCDAFNIPLLFLQDVPGFMVGTKVEQQGIIRHGAKMMYATASATVPKFTVVVRKGYGAGYYVMNGRAFEPDLLVAWPGAEIAVMGPEGMVSIAARKVLQAAESPEAAAAMKKELAEGLRPHIRIERTAAMAMVDDVVDPRDTRRLLARALKRTANKRVERPFRRREISPV